MAETIPYRFWETKSLYELTRSEWESLCDGCGRCCLNKLIDDATEELIPTRVACTLLDQDTGQCKNYKHRRRHVPDCMKFTPKTLHEFLPWLPDECAYKCLIQDRPLPQWHPLITGKTSSVEEAGHSIRSMALVSEEDLEDPADWYNYIIRV